jgi:thioesterase domain-containing protein
VHYNLLRKLDQDRPLFGLSIGSVDEKQVPCTFENIAEAHIRTLRSVRPNGPYLLGGHCLGGAIAFEMACQLSAEGERVELLALFDPLSAPGSKSVPRSWRSGMRSLVLKTEVRIRHLRAFRTREKFGYVLLRIMDRVLSRIWWTDRLLFVFDHCPLPHLIRVRLGSLRSNSQIASWAFCDYRPRLYAGRASIFRASMRPDGSVASGDLGWGEYMSQGVEVHEVPGTHFSMFMKPNVEILAQVLNFSSGQMRAS